MWDGRGKGGGWLGQMLVSSGRRALGWIHCIPISTGVQVRP